MDHTLSGMTRFAPLLLALTACAAPICAGCGADDAGRELPTEYRAAYESLISAEPSTCGQRLQDGLAISGGMMEATLGGVAPVTVEDGAWVARVPYGGDIFTTWRLEPSEDLAWATADMVREGGVGSCVGTARFVRVA